MFMKIKLQDISPEGLGVDVKEEEEFRSIAEQRGVKTLSPVTAHVDIRRISGAVEIAGHVAARLSLKCARCLEDYASTVETDFVRHLVRGKDKEREKEKELTPEEMDVTFFEGDEIELLEILFEEVSLEMPTKPLCKEDCRGLCPRCGKDLNKGECKCPPEEKIDPRFAKLKGFKVK